MAVPRSRQDQLQRLIGERGKVLPFVSVPDLRHRATGWYVRVDGEDVFLGANFYIAARLLEQYAAEHPG